jgi:signal transduction histidine kinase
VWHVLLSFYYAGIGVLILMKFIDKEDLWNSAFVDKSGQRVQASVKIVLLYTLSHHPAVIALTLFAVLIAVMLLIFWLSHLRHVLRGQTTNEAYKLEEYSAFLADEVAREEKAEAEAGDKDGDVVKGKTAAGSSSSPPMTRQRMAEELKSAQRAYDLGWRRNVLDGYFPWYAPRAAVKRTLKAGAAAAAAVSADDAKGPTRGKKKR